MMMPPKTVLNKVNLNKGEDGPSYKEALMSTAMKSRADATIPKVSSSHVDEAGTAEIKGKDIIPIKVKDADTEWFNKCLIGQVSAMYDHVFVQQIQSKLEKFMRNEKLGIPLVAWNEATFITLASRWGKFLRMDVAKVLIGVGCLSAIPSYVAIVVNGVIHNLQLNTMMKDVG
ncbi:hypothetical protein V6N13_029698 [Hibiscus sabdariffa]